MTARDLVVGKQLVENLERDESVMTLKMNPQLLASVFQPWLEIFLFNKFSHYDMTLRA